MSSGSASASAHGESPDRIRSRELAAGVQEVLSADLSEDNQAELVALERRIDSLNKEIEKRVQVTPVASSEDAGDNKTAMLRKLFEHYCKYGAGNALNTGTFLGNAQFVKFATDCGVELTSSELDILYRRVISESATTPRYGHSNKSMDFQRFIDAVAHMELAYNSAPESGGDFMGVHIAPVCAALDQNATQETYDESRETFREQEQAIRKMFAAYAKRTTFEGPLKLKMGAGEFFALAKDFELTPDLISRPDIVKLALSCVDDPVDEPAFASGMSYEAFVGCLGKLAHALFATEALAPYCPNDKDRAELLMVRMHASAASTGYFERAWIENRKQHGNIATALGALRKLARKEARWRDGMQAMKASVNHPGSGPRIKTRHKLMFGEERRSPSSVRKQQKLVQRNIKRGIRRRDEDAELTFKPQINKNYRSRNPEKNGGAFL